MKTYNSLLYLFALVFTLSFNSCSDSDSDNPESIELIVGEWLLVSENDYRCGTDEVMTDRPASNNGYDKTWVFKSDYTYENYDDGVLDDAEDQMGTWENLGEGIYRLNYTVFGEPRSDTAEIEFVTNGNTMRFGVDDECRGTGDLSSFTYTVWTRQ